MTNIALVCNDLYYTFLLRDGLHEKKCTRCRGCLVVIPEGLEPPTFRTGI